ncbi:hypothetical protein MEPL4_4c00480 [Melissococcus plutonius]|uniref:Uncharacterized protein n=1 Tax=Melissococcus plutonius (strain ATCC 35311 / DSM 29964 / CIP 104052 / LMG 20360 / NCIMB 702443) TaxID=940190 RepID=F3YBH9_MELPT|nr:hypothetical protein [Melissococcus plutonius]AIM25769.1 hypothetical protein MEPL_c010290 [Melissococcus plutonius S1]KMT23460.1 hypothetical protein MEPL2_43p00420 [Melissococcus plutonius]KMT25218.1 hypothetical protein MEPL2_2c07760 [Melissococcus plutonius]KMT26124.1 hypothetical protein MEPL3_3c00490 [Melissococcus plutonius]KMT26854.1 hypothetical protein MEPL1_4c00490 [Melissococcus plutonius]
MSKGRLIMQNKLWGEFDSYEVSGEDVIITGYRSYGGVHTIRVAEPKEKSIKVNVDELVKQTVNNLDIVASRTEIAKEVTEELSKAIRRTLSDKDFDTFCLEAIARALAKDYVDCLNERKEEEEEENEI